MSDLTKQLEEALSRRVVEFVNANNDAHIEGINFHADRLAPMHAALLKCVEALEKIANQASLEAEGDQYAANSYEHIRATAVHHLADLRKALEECK